MKIVCSSATECIFLIMAEFDIFSCNEYMTTFKALLQIPMAEKCHQLAEKLNSYKEKGVRKKCRRICNFFSVSWKLLAAANPAIR